MSISVFQVAFVKVQPKLSLRYAEKNISTQQTTVFICAVL